ncbi:hypothetical protein D3C72_685470 [compost metagenome]
MSWSAQILRFGIRVDQGLYRFGTVMGRNTGSTSLTNQVYRYGKRSLVQYGIIFYHQVQVQRICTLFCNRCTNKATAVFGHKIDDFRGNISRSGYKITFILSVFVVNNNYKLTFSYIF